uniref:Tudor domain-containing protein n=1 Tax=Acrobeloides nanus TaxID=290746 RepID=A0A914D6I1_9BILA
MVNSTLVDVIWHQRDLINVSANILESQIPEHLPVFFHGVLLYSDPINRHLGVIRVDDKRDFRKLQKEIQDFYQKNFASWQVELSEIAPQIYYVAKIGDNYYRCQVCNTKEKAGQFFVLVLLVDFGMFKKVLAQNLFNLNEEFVVGEWETARALCCTLPGTFLF